LLFLFSKPVTLVLRERNSNGRVAKLWSSTTKPLGTSFQKLSVTASAPTAGNALDLYIMQNEAGSGDAFSPTPSLPPAVAPTPAQARAHRRATAATLR